MRWDDVYLRGSATWLPPVVPALVAVDRGEVDPVMVRRMQVTGVTVGTDAPPEMAVRAARRALERAACRPEEIALILHSSAYYQGHDLWAPASYVQRMAVGNSCPAIDVGQSSNGGMVALDLAAAYLVARGGGAALLTTADRFCPPGIDRWRTDPGTVLGDGGTALVLGRGHGFARLASLVTVADAELEQMHRGADPPSPAPLTVRRPIDVDATTRAYLRTEAGQRLVTTMAARQLESMDAALAEADTKISGIDWFVLPHFGRRRMDVNYFRRLGIAAEQTTWSWSRGIGHLGAGDQFAGLAYLVETGRLRAGQRCLLLGVGGGFTWSSAVVEVLYRPDWTGGPGTPAGV